MSVLNVVLVVVAVGLAAAGFQLFSSVQKRQEHQSACVALWTQMQEIQHKRSGGGWTDDLVRQSRAVDDALRNQGCDR